MIKITFDAVVSWSHGSITSWSDSFTMEKGTSLEDIYQMIKHAIANGNDASVYEINAVALNLDMIGFEIVLR